jgi:hypothetical protein
MATTSLEPFAIVPMSMMSSPSPPENVALLMAAPLMAALETVMVSLPSPPSTLVPD